MKELNHELFDRYDLFQRSRFINYHILNPHVYNKFEELADQMRLRGRNKYSVRTIFEVMRWSFDLKTIRTDEFKISNDLIPIYVRILLVRRPEFNGFFSLKGSSNDNH